MDRVSLAAPTKGQPEAIHEQIRIEIVRDYLSFLELKPIWNAVVAAAGPAYPFLEFDWIRTWWECFGGGSQFYVLVLKTEDRTIAIAPLIRTDVRMWGIKVRRLGFFYNAHVPRAEFIVAERPKEVYRTIWRHLAQDSQWDMIQLCQLPEGCSTLTELTGLAGNDGYRKGVWQSEGSPFIVLETSWEEYFASLAAKHRANLRNRFRRLGAVGPVELESIMSSEGLGDGLEDGLRLEAAAWKGEARTAIASDPETSRFYSRMADCAADRGWMRLHFLKAGETRVAFDYSLFYKNRLHLLKLGYDPRFSQYSPSNLLLCTVLREACAEGVEEYDFLGADANWKHSWARQVRQHYWLFIFSRSLRGRILHLLKFQIVPLFRRRGLRRLRRLVQRAAALYGNRGGE